ncbi:preprotein translocase subunit SecY [Desulfuribacillus stibiiarsenatis]|uniref:Protein translocase subunit SecY n=1 Tax=Desulfuribacillus stibiiarsenatis TaxID=1390249 RepID=A0A1E5L895_9FIRM|nr:preprotein translocase subunit SecY [Desulfuribacillus stibiiarsenatis]OEH86346.1 preprotein translocase subunit SecY [Desulfuribacillus stibiiarsenatis]
MQGALRNIWKIDDLRSKIIFTLLLLLVFRIGSHIPVPNVDANALKAAGEANNILGMLNTFSGGALANFSVFAMSIAPYITASIIVQLLTMDVIPKFAEWAREGDAGRKKLAQVTRYGTVVLGLIQAIGLSVGFNRMYPGLVQEPSFSTYALIAITLTAGTAFLMWLGEQITEHGIGNGISVIIFAGIAASIPGGITTIYAQLFYDKTQAELFVGLLQALAILIGVVIIIAGVIYIQQGVRKIPVQYAKRVVGNRMYGGQKTHIPVKVNAAGVIPVIFASSLMLFPSTVASFWRGNVVADWFLRNFDPRAGLYLFLFVILIIGFTYFYTFVQINPMNMAEQMKKNSGFIPGIRPGKTTAMYITRVMNRITLAGAIFLAAVSVLPVLFGSITGLQIYFGGTALLIVIGVALDTMKQIENQLLMRHYQGFIKK